MTTEPASKLPSHFRPVNEKSALYGIKIGDMNRYELLQVIQWLSAEVRRQEDNYAEAEQRTIRLMKAATR